MLMPDGTIKSGLELCVADDGTIVSVQEQCTGNKNEESICRLDGLLMPGLINAHCHLELSWSKNMYPAKAGMEAFYGAMSGIHGRRPDDAIVQTAIQEAIDELTNNGTVAVCDISNTQLTLTAKNKSPLHFYTFLECFGTNPAEALIRMKSVLELQTVFTAQNQPGSLSAHTLFTLSDALMGMLMTKISADRNVHSIHFMESLSEKDFFEKKRPVKHVHDQNNVNTTYNSASDAACSILPRKNKTLFVHNTYAEEIDIQKIQHHFSDPWFCLCPASNLYINDTLPDVPMILKNTSNIVIGTDSYSSNTELNLFSEIDILLKAFSSVSAEQLLMAATLNGAEFMGLGSMLGSFEINKKPGLIGLTDYRPGCRNFSSLKITRFI
jgi:cytosine/adenosine deaminase-related metal-dependent hydrolase